MNFYSDLSRFDPPVDLMSTLRSSWLRSKLKGKRVAYRVRWDRETERGGTIGRVEHAIIWIGPACLHHDDIISITEVIENG